MVPLLSRVKGFLALPGFTVVPIEPANVSDALPAAPLVTLREDAKLLWVMYHKPQEYPTVPELVCPIVKNPVSIQSYGTSSPAFIKSSSSVKTPLSVP